MNDATSDALAQPGAQTLLREALLLRLAYDGTDGTPRVVPIGFFWTGGRVVICTATTAPKVKALGARPQVALTIDSGSTPMDATALLIRGTAELEVVPGVPEEYIEGARKVMDPAMIPEFQRICEETYDAMVRITIEPAWARYFDFGAGRMPGFLERLTQGAGND
jgi:hypothetical protein